MYLQLWKILIAITKPLLVNHGNLYNYIPMEYRKGRQAGDMRNENILFL